MSNLLYSDVRGTNIRQRSIAIHIDTFTTQWKENHMYQGILMQDGFTQGEKEYATSFKSYQHLAVRFACKCALSEVSGQTWNSFEIKRTEAGVPYVDHSIPNMISLTHDGAWAIAYVLIYTV